MVYISRTGEVNNNGGVSGFVSGIKKKLIEALESIVFL